MKDNKNKNIKNYTIKELRELCQKPVSHLKIEDNKVGLFSLRFSIYFTRLFLHTKITSNQITILSVLVFFSGISLFLYNIYLLNIVGSLLIFFSIVLDGCDGEVARFRGKASRLGGVYVEPISHDIQYGFAFLIISCGLVMKGFPPYFFVLGGMAGLMKLSTRLLQIRFSDLLRNSISDDRVIDMHESIKKKSIFIKIAYRFNKNFFTNSGVFVVLFIFSLLNRIDLAIWFFGIGYSLIWIAIFGKQAYQIYKYNL